MDPTRRSKDNDDGKSTKSSAPDSVQRLLTRWEISSTTGTPLHPDMGMDQLGTSATSATATPPTQSKRILTVSFSNATPEVTRFTPSTTLTTTTASATPGSDRRSSTETDKGIPDHSTTVSSSIDLFADIERGLCQEGLLKLPATPSPAATDQEGGDDSATSQFSVSAYRKKSLIDRRGANRTGQTVDTNSSNLIESPQSDRTPHDEADSTVAKLSSDDEDVCLEEMARMKRLREAMSAQQTQILQARQAIAQCRRDEKFTGSQQEIEAQMALLLASERRRALQAAHEAILSEIHDREEAEGGMSTPRPMVAAYEPRGTLSISRISVQLSDTFREKSGFVDECFYVVALIKFCDGTVLSTQLICTDDDDGEGWLELTMPNDGIKLKNLRPDFDFQLEVYRLRSYECLVVAPAKPKKSKKRSGVLGGLMKMIVPTRRTDLRIYTGELNAKEANSSDSTGSKSTRNTTKEGELCQKSVTDPFQLAGSITLKSSECSHQQEFKLTEPIHPLEGSVHFQASYSIYLQKTTVDGDRKKGALRRRI